MQSLAARLRVRVHGVPFELALAVPIVGSTALAPVVIRVGSPRSVRVQPAQVLRQAIAANARQVALAHNHVDDIGISEEDRAVTRHLVAASAVLGIRLRAHLVLTPQRWFDALDPRETARWYADEVLPCVSSG